MIKIFSSILLGFRENPKLGSAIAKNSRIHECLLVMLIILRLSTNASTSTHTNCLIQLLKSVSMGPKVSTEAAHSTPPIPLVKHPLNDFSFQLSRLPPQPGPAGSRSGRRIIQRKNQLSTAPRPAARLLWRTPHNPATHPTR